MDDLRKREFAETTSPSYLYLGNDNKGCRTPCNNISSHSWQGSSWMNCLNHSRHEPETEFKPVPGGLQPRRTYLPPRPGRSLLSYPSKRPSKILVNIVMLSLVSSFTELVGICEKLFNRETRIWTCITYFFFFFTNSSQNIETRK